MAPLVHHPSQQRRVSRDRRDAQVPFLSHRRTPETRRVAIIVRNDNGRIQRLKIENKHRARVETRLRLHDERDTLGRTHGRHLLLARRHGDVIHRLCNAEHHRLDAKLRPAKNNLRKQNPKDTGKLSSATNKIEMLQDVTGCAHLFAVVPYCPPPLQATARACVHADAISVSYAIGTIDTCGVFACAGCNRCAWVPRIRPPRLQRWLTIAGVSATECMKGDVFKRVNVEGDLPTRDPPCVDNNAAGYSEAACVRICIRISFLVKPRIAQVWHSRELGTEVDAEMLGAVDQEAEGGHLDFKPAENVRIPLTHTMDQTCKQCLLVRHVVPGHASDVLPVLSRHT
eukprot:Opistho-2@90064